MSRRTIEVAVVLLLAGVLLTVAYVSTQHDGDEGDAAYAQATATPDGVAGVEVPTRDPSLPRPEIPGHKRVGNCDVPNDATEVFSGAATQAGGRVFDYGNTRYFVLPDGRCISFKGFAPPWPDWPPPETLNTTPVPGTVE
jgi:hypothetical protein